MFTSLACVVASACAVPVGADVGADADTGETGDGDGDGDGDVGGACLEPVVLPPATQVDGDTWGLSAPNLELWDFHGDASTRVLVIHGGYETEQFDVEVTIPYGSLPAQVDLWEPVTMAWDETPPGPNYVLYDSDGLIAGAVTDSRSDATIHGVHLTVDTDCAELGEDGFPLEPVAGYVTASMGGEHVRVEVGEPVMIGLDGFAHDIWVTTATANPCCDGDVLSAAIVRRP